MYLFVSVYKNCKEDFWRPYEKPVKVALETRSNMRLWHLETMENQQIDVMINQRSKLSGFMIAIKGLENI